MQPDNWRPPTPPRDALQPYNHHHDQEQRDPIHSPPLTDSSSSSSPQHPNHYETIRGYESWTIEDDKILMAHVLTRLSGCRWQEAALKLRGKHSPTVCEKRWQVLRDLLIRGADKSGTRGW